VPEKRKIKKLNPEKLPKEQQILFEENRQKIQTSSMMQSSISPIITTLSNYIKNASLYSKSEGLPDTLKEIMAHEVEYFIKLREHTLAIFDKYSNLDYCTAENVALDLAEIQAQHLERPLLKHSERSPSAPGARTYDFELLFLSSVDEKKSEDHQKASELLTKNLSQLLPNEPQFVASVQRILSMSTLSITDVLFDRLSPYSQFKELTQMDDSLGRVAKEQKEKLLENIKREQERKAQKETPPDSGHVSPANFAVTNEAGYLIPMDPLPSVLVDPKSVSRGQVNSGRGTIHTPARKKKESRSFPLHLTRKELFEIMAWDNSTKEPPLLPQGIRPQMAKVILKDLEENKIALHRFANTHFVISDVGTSSVKLFLEPVVEIDLDEAVAGTSKVDDSLNAAVRVTEALTAFIENQETRSLDFIPKNLTPDILKKYTDLPKRSPTVSYC
jgi:hypothetical protein